MFFVIGLVLFTAAILLAIRHCERSPRMDDAGDFITEHDDVH